MKRSPLFTAALQFANSRVLILKNLAPEIPQLIARELALRKRLYALHRAGARRAVTRAVQASPNLKRIETACRVSYERTFTPGAREAIRLTMPRFYRLGKRAVWRKAMGYSRGAIRVDLPRHDSDEIAKAEVRTPETLIDDDAIEALTRHHVFWVGEHYERNISERIAYVARELIVRRGLSGGEAARELGDALRREFDLLEGGYTRGPGVPLPAGWRGTAEAYLHGLASGAATTGRTFGSLKALEEAQVERYRIRNPLDERTCAICKHMAGKIFEVTAASGLARKILSAKKPDDVKKLHPWLSYAELLMLSSTAGQVSAADSMGLLERGITFPPYHGGGCRCSIDLV